MTRFAKNLFRTQLCIFAVIFLPPIFFFFRYSTSLAFGVLVASVLIYILAPRKYVLTTLDLKILILVALVILVHSFIVLGLMEFDIDRAITSLALLLIVMLAGMSLGRMKPSARRVCSTSSATTSVVALAFRKPFRDLPSSFALWR